MNNKFKSQSLNRKSYRKFTLSWFSVTCFKHVGCLWPINALDRKQVRGYISLYIPSAEKLVPDNVVTITMIMVSKAHTHTHIYICIYIYVYIYIYIRHIYCVARSSFDVNITDHMLMSNCLIYFVSIFLFIVSWKICTVAHYICEDTYKRNHIKCFW